MLVTLKVPPGTVWPIRPLATMFEALACAPGAGVGVGVIGVRLGLAVGVPLGVAVGWNAAIRFWMLGLPKPVPKS